jgi:hypothetical protein
VAGGRRPYRVVFEEEQGDGTTRRGTVVVSDLDQARREAQAIIRGGRRAEVHYVADDGQHAQLDVYPP